MSNYKKTAILEAFRYLTLPYRIVSSQRHRRDGTMPVVILYYHRVADTDPVPWSLTNDQFRKHIDWLQRHYEMISLAEAQRRVAEGSRRPSVHLTFDDGYAENCDLALPLLIERGIPCTYFVTLDNVANQKPFVHDQDRGGEFPVNTIAQLCELADQGIEIAAHTRTHPDLGQLHDLPGVYDEVVLAKRELSQLLGRPVRYFAFPFGMKPNLNHAAAAMAKAEGIECVVSAYGGYNHCGDDTFHLQRCHADPELIRLRNAVTFDPRHMRKQKAELATDGPNAAAAIEFYEQQKRSFYPAESSELTPAESLPLTTS
jgi:peptidoglycan/xylan/chitin deacetylase (PgdA/CDA1 family)